MTDDFVPDPVSATRTGQTAELPPPPPVGSRPAPSVSPKPAPVFALRSNKPVARWNEVLLVLGAGLFGNFALRSSIASVSTSIAFVLVVVAMVAAGRGLRRDSKLLILMALVLAPWLFIRAEAGLTAITVATILGLLALGGALSSHGSLFDGKVRDFVHHCVAVLGEWVYGSAMLKRLFVGTTTQPQSLSLLRGVLVAAPVLLLFGVLLASADEVFAKFLLLDNVPTLVGHLLLTLMIAIGLFGFVSRAAHETKAMEGRQNLRILGAIEVNMILGSLALLFAAFVGTQIVVAVGGADRILETEGLTQAEHARSGFFQLLWVSALSVGLVGVLRSTRIAGKQPRATDETASDETHDETDKQPTKDRFRPLALVTLALTLAIAAVSIKRLSLYVGSFGLTPLRLWALVGTGAIALAIMTYAVSIAGYRSDRSWYPAVAGGVVFGLVLALNILNPDATIANYNLDRAATDDIDIEALASLSDDATTTVVARLDEIGPQRDTLTNMLCNRWDRETSFGVFEYNRSAISGDKALDELCGARRTTQSGD